MIETVGELYDILTEKMKTGEINRSDSVYCSDQNDDELSHITDINKIQYGHVAFSTDVSFVQIEKLDTL